MAFVTKVATAAGGIRYRARWRGPDGKAKEKWFDKKREAEAFLTTVEHGKLAGSYVDPRAGKALFADFAAGWLASQTFDESTREAVALRIRVHLNPTFGPMELRAIRPSTVQAWLRGRQASSSPRYVRVMLANLSSILGAAVADELIVRNPCASAAVKAPPVERSRIVPWTVEKVGAVAAGVPDQYRAMVPLGAGAGLRQGEIFGLRTEDVDFLRRTIRVRQQVKVVGGKVKLAPPKRGKARDVPLPHVVAVELSEHMRRQQLGPGDGLLFVTRESNPVHRSHFNRYVWQPALAAAGLEPGRANGMHALRHHYASVLLDGGVSIRALAEYLGHEDPGFTLRTYTHLMPASEDRARDAIDAAHSAAAPGTRGGVAGLDAANDT